MPHDLVLPHIAAVICHGGLSTVTATLTAGVPLVCIPQGRDQPWNAAPVVAAGVGRIVATDATSAAIAASVEGSLADEGTRQSVRRFADAIAQLGAERRRPVRWSVFRRVDGARVRS